MSPTFDGYVLRKPRYGDNERFGADPDAFVRDPDRFVVDPDEVEFLDHYVASDAGLNEYLAVPAHNGSLVVPSNGVTGEAAEDVNGNRTTFSFNPDKLGVENVSVDPSNPTPDRIDERRSLIEYDNPVDPSDLPIEVDYDYTPLQINWVRNDPDVRRFGWDDGARDWRPYPGTSPESVGRLDSSRILQTDFTENWTGPVRLVVSDPAGSVEDWDAVPVDDGAFDQYVQGTHPSSPLGSDDVVLNESDGRILVSSDILSSYEDEEFYVFRINFLSPRESDGVIGEVGDTLVISPIPRYDSSSEHDYPLIRIGWRTHLVVEPGDVDQPVPSGVEAVWDEETGEVALSSDLESTFDGETVYYDGVYNVADPIGVSVDETLGQLGGSLASLSQNVDYGNVVLYVEETGAVVPEVEVVESNSEFTQSFELSPDKAQVSMDTGDVNVSLGLESEHSGRTLKALNPDFEIEGGVTLRIPRDEGSPRNDPLSNDGTLWRKHDDELVTESVPPGPFVAVEDPPLVDLPGYGDGQFLKRVDGPSVDILQDGIDIVHDFEERRAFWATTESVRDTVRTPSTSRRLPHPILVEDSVELSLDEGSGPSSISSDQYIVNPDDGLLDFVDTEGPILAEFSGEINQDLISGIREDLSSLSGTYPADVTSPVVVSEEEAFRLVEVFEQPTDVWNVRLSSDSDRTETTDATIREAPEVIRRVGFESIDVTPEDLRMYRLRRLEENDPGRVPLPSEWEFLSDGSSISSVELDRVNLGTLSDHSTSPLTIPSGPIDYTASTSRFEIWRDGVELTETTTLPPSPGEFYLDDVTLELTFASSDINDYPSSDIVFVPELSQNRLTGPVEVLTEDGSIGLADDHTDVVLSVLVPEDKWDHSNSTVSFARSFAEGEGLRVTYRTEDGSFETERIGFDVREELDASTSTTFSFAAGVEIIEDAGVTLLTNGFPVQAESLDVSAKTIVIPDGLGNRRVEVSYQRAWAEGGENTAFIRGEPNPRIPLWTAGSTEQTLPGDVTSELGSGIVVIAGDQTFEVVSATYDASDDLTELELSNAPISDIRDFELFVTSDVPTTSTVMVDVDPVSQGSNEISVVGDVRSSFKESGLVFFDDVPSSIASVEYDEESMRTVLSLRTRLTIDVSDPVVEVSDDRVYPPNPTELRSESGTHSSKDHVLLRFDGNGDGVVVSNEYQYELQDSGRVLLDESNIDLPEDDEIWQLAHVARRTVEPQMINGVRFDPILEASYTRRIGADLQNGIQGSNLFKTGFSRRPDSYYFRVVSMEDFSAEVANAIGTPPAGGTPENWERGNTGVTWAVGDLRDRDRVAVSLIDFYHRVATAFEALLEIADGRLIGDRDGKFQFFIEDGPGTSPSVGDPVARGARHPVTGEILPWYANPLNPGQRPTSNEILDMDMEEQSEWVRNQIDDRILVRKAPVEIDLLTSLPFVRIVLKGTIESAWEPNFLSRFYPERRHVRTITAPSHDYDPNDSGTWPYDFPQDFGRYLADLGVDDVQSIRDLQSRGAATWLEEGDVEIVGSELVELQIATEYDDDTGEFNHTQDALEGGSRREQFRPAFSSGDHVNIGRVETTRTSEGTVGIDVNVYAENLVVDSVDPSAGTITVESNPWIGQAQNSGRTATDAETLHPDVTSADGDLTPAGATPRRGDTIFAVPPTVENLSFSPGDALLTFGNPLPANNPNYRVGTDVTANQRRGELRNFTLPEVVGLLVGQDVPTSYEYLEADVDFSNASTTPDRFPALDGGVLDDDEDQRPPLAQPLSDSDVRALNLLDDVIASVLNDTTAGLIQSGASPVSGEEGTTFDFGLDLDTVTPSPEVYDPIWIEGILDGSGGSFPFRYSSHSTTEVTVAPFLVEDASVTYEIDNLHSGTGQRDSVNNDEFNDGSTDFTNFQGADTVTLVIDSTSNSYQVDTLSNGTLTTVNPISESGTEAYHLEMTGTGAIGADLVELQDVDIDFSNAQGDLLLTSGINSTHDALGPDAQAGEFTIDRGGQDFVIPEVRNLPTSGTFVVDLSVSDDVTSGTGAISVTDDAIYTTDSVADVEAGQRIQIPSSSPNGGSWLVDSVIPNPGGDSRIVIDGSIPFRADEGTPGMTYPVSWTATDPRRFSLPLDEMREELVRLRPLYVRNNDNPPSDISGLLTHDIENPSAPYRDRLDELRSLTTNTVVSVTGGSVAPANDLTGKTFQSGTIDFLAQGVEDGDYVLVREGDNVGYYKVSDVDTDEIEVTDPLTLEYPGTALVDENPIDFEVLSPIERFDSSSVELVLHETANVETEIDRIDRAIRITIDDANDFGAGGDREGDPSDALLSTIRSGFQDRLSWLTGDPSLVRDSLEVLNVREDVYERRYAWIDYRINQETGTLSGRDRQIERAERAEERRKQDRWRKTSL